MKRLWAIGVCGLLCVVLRAPAGAQGGDDVTFKVDVSLVNLLVTVVGPDGQPVADLSKEDFQVVDGGSEREIAVFERRTDRPLSIALMVDTSLSTAKELDFERAAAKRFVANVLDEPRGRDRVAVFGFSDAVAMHTGFVRSVRQLERGLGRLRAEGGTSLYDAVSLASGELRRRNGRRVMVVIADGGDTTSYGEFEEAMRAAHEVDAVIYSIIVVPVQNDAGRNVGGENALKTLSANTGGSTFIQYGTDNLDRAFDGILRNLRTQYFLGYYPPPPSSRRETFRDLEVRTSRSDTTVLSRNGYYLPTRIERPRRSRVEAPRAPRPPRRGWPDADEEKDPIATKPPNRTVPDP